MIRLSTPAVRSRRFPRPFPGPLRPREGGAPCLHRLARRLLAVVALVPALLAGCGGAATGVPVAYVAVSGDNHVRVVDLERGETLRRIYTGASPWRLARSPADGRLWVQHWYSGTTVVVDPDRDHQVVGSLPFRGPGAFLPGGDWMTADWPGRTLARVDGASLEVRGEHDSEIKEIYDLASPGGDGGRLLLAQYDPMSRGGRAPRYGYVLTYRLPEQGGEGDEGGESAGEGGGETSATVPLSHPVGRDPVRVVPVPGQPFFLTADSGTNGIHLVNELGDRRSLAVCPAPREIAVSADGTRTAVVCWRGRGAPSSRVVMLDSDYTVRPWPQLRPRAEVELAAGLVAAAHAPGLLWVADRTGGRLLALDDATLELRREIPVGDLPEDLLLATLTPAQRERAAAPPPHRRPLMEALARLGERSGTFRDLSWVETLSWQEAVADAGSGGQDEGEEAAPVERSRRLRVSLRAPDALRTETADGAVRLASGSDAVSLDPEGRFWTTPRQDLLGVVLGLPALEPEEALRRLAGDVPGGEPSGGPALANGIAVDRLAEVEDGSGRFLVVGADPQGERVSQLWIDLDSALPVQLVERFPVFAAAGAASGHGGSTPPAVAETVLEDWQPVGGAGDDGTPPPLLPRRLRRVLEGSWVQDARLDDVERNRDLPEAAFDPARLGGLPRPAALFGAGAAEGSEAVPVDRGSTVVGGPFVPHPAYRSNPPTSGAHLDWAADPGVHRLPVPLPLQVHHLLDGGVAIQYDCPGGCPELVASLARVAAAHDRVLVAPYPWLLEPGDEGPAVVLTAWGRLLRLDGFDAGAVEAFVERWGGRDHHGELPPGSGHGAGAATPVADRR